MFLNDIVPYPKILRNHFLIALLLGVMVVFIVIFLQPYGAGLNNFPFKNLYFIGYGILVFFSYLLAYFLFNTYYKKVKEWAWTEELFFVLFFISFMIALAYLYTELAINKNPSRIKFTHFIEWFKIVFLGFGIIIGIVTVLLRKHFALSELNHIYESKPKPYTSKEEENIIIKSTLKSEFLSVKKSTIVYAKSDDNYVTIYYIEKNILKNKMLRSTLSNIHNQLQLLLKIHRSYLVNPIFIEELKGNSQHAKINLKDLEITIPVSKTYYNTIKSAIN